VLIEEDWVFLKKGYYLSSMESSALLFAATVTSHLLLYSPDVLLSFVIADALSASEMGPFSYLTAQNCWFACQCSLNYSRHDIKPLHFKAVLWSFNNPISSLNLWVSYIVALANSHQPELWGIPLLDIRILGYYVQMYEMCFAFMCLSFFITILIAWI
jgi:hypothetical protein